MHPPFNCLRLNLRYALLQATVWGTSCALTTFATLFLLQQGFSNTGIGILVAVSNIAAVLAQPWIAARRTALPSLIALICLLGATLGCAMLLFGKTPYTISVFFIPLIVMISSLMGPLNALCMDYVNYGVALNYGLGRGMGSFGFATVAYLLGSFAQQYGVFMIPLTYTVLFIITCGAALSFSKSHGAIEKQKKRIPTATASCGIRKLLTQNKPFCALIVCCFFLMTCSNSVSAYMTNIITARGGNSTTMGEILSLGAFIELPCMAAFSLLVRRFTAITLLRFSSVFLTAKAFLLCATNSLSGVFAAQLLQPFGYALFIPATVYCTNQMLKAENRLLGQTLMMSTNTLALVVGSLCGGFLLDRYDAFIFIAINTVISGAGAVLAFFIRPGLNHLRVYGPEA